VYVGTKESTNNRNQKSRCVNVLQMDQRIKRHRLTSHHVTIPCNKVCSLLYPLVIALRITGQLQHSVCNIDCSDQAAMVGGGLPSALFVLVNNESRWFRSLNSIAKPVWQIIFYIILFTLIKTALAVLSPQKPL